LQKGSNFHHFGVGKKCWNCSSRQNSTGDWFLDF